MASHYSWWPVPVQVIAKFGPLDRKRTAAGRARATSSATARSSCRNGCPTIRSPWCAIRGTGTRQRSETRRDPFLSHRGHFHRGAHVPHRPGPQDQRAAQLQDRLLPPRPPRRARNSTLPGRLLLPLQHRHPPAAQRQARPPGPCPRDRSRVHREERHPRRPAARLRRELSRHRRLLPAGPPAPATSPRPGACSPRPVIPDGKGCPTIELCYNTSENHRAIAEAIQQMWRKELGVNVELTQPGVEGLPRYRRTPNYMMQRAGWIADYVDPHVFLEIWETGGGNNDTSWSNAEYDRLLHAALAAPRANPSATKSTSRWTPSSSRNSPSSRSTITPGRRPQPQGEGLLPHPPRQPPVQVRYLEECMGSARPPDGRLADG
jgi:oligopeptide transport system substrate-binding protein